jgi:hypothetical protein
LLDRAFLLDQYFRDKKIYFEFGHADEGLFELFLLAILLSVINIAIAIARLKSSKMSIKN